jgi:hypothetical protein
VTNWAPTPCGKCVGHLRRTTQLRLNFAAPLIELADRLPSADFAKPRAYLGHDPRRLEFAPAHLRSDHRNTREESADIG